MKDWVLMFFVSCFEILSVNINDFVDISIFIVDDLVGGIQFMINVWNGSCDFCVWVEIDGKFVVQV